MKTPAGVVDPADFRSEMSHLPIRALVMYASRGTEFGFMDTVQAFIYISGLGSIVRVCGASLYVHQEETQRLSFESSQTMKLRDNHKGMPVYVNIYHLYVRTHCG
jgi:hypothetical protein